MMRAPLVVAIVAFVIAIAAAAGVIIIGFAGSTSPWGSLDANGVRAKDLPAGERIFRYGLDGNGRPIPRSGGMMGGGTGCAGCHGQDGRGRTTRSFTSPDITYANLTDPQGMLEPDGARGHDYTDAQIRTAVTEGIDPAGAQLEWPMPRWDLSDAEWSALLGYLKTLP